MNQNTLYFSLVVSLAGFLFGFDTVVISGANLPIKELWQTSPWFHGTFIMSMALWGTVVGSLFGGIPCQRVGRKKTLIFVGVLYFVSAVGSGIAPDPYTFSFFRFIGGLGVGASTVAAPTYISEISNAGNRGKLVALYQFNLVLGILMAYFSNYLLDDFGGENDWRWMLGVEAIPAALYTVLVVFVPASPRWLVMVKKDFEKARDVLIKIGVSNYEEALKEMVAADEAEEVRDANLVQRYSLPLLLAFLIAFFNQLSGINFVLYYAPEIMEIAGLGSKESLMNAIAIGGINLIFTLLGMSLIDRLGRRQLIVFGSLGYIWSLTMIACCFLYDLDPSILLVSILIFIASHAIGQGTVIWVFISEIFPNRFRAYGQAVGTGTHWVFAALITLLGPVVISSFGSNPAPIFIFFAVMMVLQFVFAVTLMPETKGKTLEKIEQELKGMTIGLKKVKSDE